MRPAIVAIAAAGVLTIAPSMVMAKTINSQLTQGQIDSYCAGGAAAKASSASFTLGNGKTISGSVDCATAGQPSLSAANGSDDNGSESGNDSDASHED